MTVSWELITGSFGDQTLDVSATDSIDRLAREATVVLDDPQGDAVDFFDFGDQVNLRRDGQTQWIGIKTGDREKRDVYEVQANSYDYFLTRQVTVAYESTLISDILQDLIDRTPINWDASEVNVQNDREIDFELRGESIKSGMESLSQLSAAEDFGVTNFPTTNTFFFKPRGTDSAPFDFTEDNYITAEFGNDDRKEINRVVLYYGEGEDSDKVVVEDSNAISDLSSSAVYDGDAKLELSRYRPEITSESAATERANALLDQFSSVQFGTIETVGAFDLEPGQEIRVVNSRNNIDDQFRIVELNFEWRDDDTTVRVAEAVDGVLSTISKNAEETRRIEHHNVADQTDSDQAPSGSGPTGQRNPTVIEEQEIADGDWVGYREYVPDGLRLRVDELGVLPQGLSSVTDLTAEVVDAGSSTVLLSTSQKREAGAPVDIFDGELDALFRVRNQTGSPQTAAGRFVQTVIQGLEGFAEVTITGTNSPIDSGNTLDVDVTVQNTGADEITQDIILTVDGAQKDSNQGVTLSAGGQTSFTLSWSSDSSDEGEFTVRVESDDSASTTTAKVGDAVSFFDVTIAGTNEPVEVGELLDVTTDVENTGGVQDSQDIVLEADNAQRDIWPGFVLGSGDTGQVVLRWDTSGASPGSYTATVKSDDDSDSVGVSVIGPNSLCSGGTLSNHEKYTQFSQTQPTIDCRNDRTKVAPYSLYVDNVTDPAERAGAVLSSSSSVSSGTISQWVYVKSGVGPTAPCIFISAIKNGDTTAQIFRAGNDSTGAAFSLESTDTNNLDQDDKDTGYQYTDFVGIWFNMKVDFTFNNDGTVTAGLELKWESNNQGLPTTYQSPTSDITITDNTGPGQVGVGKLETGSSAGTWFNNPVYNI